MVRRNRREQIYTTALNLFEERGYYGTGMGDIAKDIGMATSSLYNHYSSKQEILAEIMENSMEALLRQNARGLAGIVDPVDKIRACMREHVIFHAENQKAVQVSNKELDSLEEPSRSVVLQLRKDYAARWVQIVEEGVQQGAFSVKDSKIVTWAIIDMGSGVSGWYTSDGEYSSEQLGNLYADLAVKQLGV